jgi:hypothetical protein
MHFKGLAYKKWFKNIGAGLIEGKRYEISISI